MPVFSAFTPCGMLAFSGKNSRAQAIFESIVAGFGGNYASGGVQEARIYANAMAIARARYTLERAQNQALPSKATDLLPRLEQMYGIIPAWNATLDQRRAALSAAYLLPGGAFYENIVAVLKALLGADFVGLYVPTYTAASPPPRFPLTLGAQPQNLAPVNVSRALGRLDGTVSVGLGSAQPVTYAPLDLGLTTTLAAGQSVVVDGDRRGLGETVTVTAATPTTFTAIFRRAHDAGATLTTQPWPYAVTARKHTLVLVSPAASASAETRRKIHRAMASMVRGISTWSIATNSGPFEVGVGQLGVTPIGSTPLPP